MAFDVSTEPAMAATLAIALDAVDPDPTALLNVVKNCESCV
jgi:hypothetical protein